ncbi:MAG: hypothetical protein IJP92_17120 [Lachnospiraceae bacterium]|nr:hypothetical protein [Lachnospiraceae bacterium]
MKPKTTRNLRNLRKRTIPLFALLCALLAATLSACGGREEDTAKTALSTLAEEFSSKTSTPAAPATSAPSAGTKAGAAAVEEAASASAAESSTASGQPGRTGNIMQDLGEDKYQFFSAVFAVANEMRELSGIIGNIANEAPEAGMSPEETQQSLEKELADLMTREGLEAFFGKSSRAFFGNSPDAQKAAAAVLAPHAGQLMELVGQAGYISPDYAFYDLLASGGLDFEALYDSFSSGREASAAIPDTPQKALADIRVPDPVLFDQDGVRVTFDGCTTDGEDVMSHAAFLFTVENNNPDNKKFFLGMKAFGVNGIVLENIGSLHTDTGGWYEYDGLESGETLHLKAEAQYGLTLARACDALGIAAADFPIETVTFVFDARVGSDNEFERMNVVCKTEAWQNESFRNAFGEYAGTISNHAHYDVLTELDVYGKMDDKGLMAVLCPSKELGDPFAIGDYPETSWISFAVNGKQAYPTAGLGEEGGWTDTAYLYPGFVYVTRLYLTEDELRKQLEIGNSEPMEIQLRIDSYGDVAEQFITIANR